MSGRHNECVSSSRVQYPSIPPFISPTGLPPSCHPSISAHKRHRRSRAELGKRVCLTRSHRTLVFLPRHALRTPNGPSRMRTHTPTRTVRYRNRSPVCTLIGPRPVSFAFSAPSLRCVVHGLPRLAPVDRSSTRHMRGKKIETKTITLALKSLVEERSKCYVIGWWGITKILIGQRIST